MRCFPPICGTEYTAVRVVQRDCASLVPTSDQAGAVDAWRPAWRGRADGTITLANELDLRRRRRVIEIYGFIDSLE